TGSAPGFDVQAPRTMTRLAAHVLRVFSFRLQPSVGGCSEIAHDLFVAGGAFLRADELRAREAGRSENRSVSRAARKEEYGQRYCSSGAPQQAFAVTEHPSS